MKPSKMLIDKLKMYEIQYACSIVAVLRRTTEGMRASPLSKFDYSFLHPTNQLTPPSFSNHLPTLR